MHRSACVPIDNLDMHVPMGRQELSARHPTVAFTHAFPGAVKTPIGNNLPLWVLLLFLPMKAVEITPEQSATGMCRALAWGGFQRGGWRFCDQQAETREPSKHQTPEARALVWEHAAQLTETAAAASSQTK
jgi:hypothetical protein